MLAFAQPYEFPSSGQACEEKDSFQYHDYELQLDSDIKNVLSSVKKLLWKYKMYNKSSETPVVAGGLQQYILNKLRKKGDEKSLTQRLKALYLREDVVTLTYNSSASTECSPFDQLPVDVKLHIFSYLDAGSLCRACSVSRAWNELLWDNLLWRDRLARDKPTWAQVSHVTNPQVYTDAASDLSSKEIYLRCSPEVAARQREESSAFHQVSSVLKSLMPRKAPRVAMFGPGIEGATSSIVRRILYESTSPFNRIALFPGQFDGFGAGMTLQLPSPGMPTFHLTVLYSSTKRERDQLAPSNRLLANRMMHQAAAGPSNQADDTYDLLPSLQQLCHTLNAFIFVTDASGTKKTIAEGRMELKSMVQERWASPQVPVLVLACVPTAGSPRVPAVDVATALQLSSFTRPWMVMDCVADTLDCVEKGVRWMVETCQRK